MAVTRGTERLPDHLPHGVADADPFAVRAIEGTQLTSLTKATQRVFPLFEPNRHPSECFACLRVSRVNQGQHLTAHCTKIKALHDSPTGLLAGHTQAITTNAALTLPLPDFREDLAAVVYPPPRLAAIPLSIKTRLGYDEVIVERWIEHLLLESPAVISLHGRTLQQMYKGEADWAR